MPVQFTSSYVEDARAVFEQYKSLADRAIAQVTDEQLSMILDDEANSIALICKHMAGNMRSRWTDFLTTDGEKPDRKRDCEFEGPAASRQEMLAVWEAGWKLVFASLDELNEQDLGKTVTIRGEAHSVMQAINRQVAHYAYHCGQIVMLAKHFQHHSWKSLSVPRGRSEEFNQQMRAGEAGGR